MDDITLSNQLDVLSDLRRPISYERFATPKQLQKLNIALKEILGDEYRVVILRAALNYADAFKSTKQLYFSDASGLIKWLWEEDDGRKDRPSKPLSILALQELLRRHLESLYVEVIGDNTSDLHQGDSLVRAPVAESSNPV